MEAEPRPLDGEDAQDEVVVGQSQEGLLANKLVRALSRAARSFLLYDTRNEAIRNFLGEYRAAAERCLQSGPLRLDVRPFELLREGEIIYVERDRERSLAFRLFRDGVRGLQIQPEVRWEELLRLLEILSVRFVGVRQAEDDIVTLLWKAGFQQIQIQAVEGFVPEEEGGAEVGSASEAPVEQRRSNSRAEVPSDWDQPLPPLVEGAPYRYREVPEHLLIELQEEMTSVQLPAHCLRLLRELLSLAIDPTDPTEFADAMGLIEEVRTFLLSEGQLSGLLELVQLLGAARRYDAERFDAELRRCADTATLRRILSQAARLSERAPPELMELLELIPGDHLSTLLQIVAEDRNPVAEQIAHVLVLRAMSSRGEWLAAQVASGPGPVAALILGLAEQHHPAAARILAAQHLSRPEPEVQEVILRIFRAAPEGSWPTRELIELLGRAPTPELHQRLLDLIISTGDARAYDAVLAQARPELPEEQLSALGVALARLDPARAREQMSNWIRPGRWLSRTLGVVAGSRSQQWMSVAGLASLPGTEVEEIIRWLSGQADAGLHRHCMRALHERRRRSPDVQR